GVINYGDSIRDRRSRSNTSINSTNSKVSPLSPWQGSCCSQTTDVSTETIDIARYRVVLLGDSGVGKTALVSQFMTSEYMNTYDASLDDEFGEKTVCILLDGEESEVVFIDHPSSEMSGCDRRISPLRITMRPSSNTCKRARPSSAGSPPAALPSTSAELPMPPPVAPPTAPPPPAHARDRRLAPPKSRTPSAARHSSELRQVP
ncbi:hypothetical protein GE061_008481, partial [Apolygus lucorum]